MKKNYIIFSAISLGALATVIDAVLDSLIFYNGTILELLITKVPPHEIYIRLVILFLFIVFGIIVNTLYQKEKVANILLKENNEEFLAINEELRQTMEELQLSKEIAQENELIAKESNEEYLSINEELRQTMEELQIAKERAEQGETKLIKTNKEIELNNIRLESLLNISQYQTNSIQELLDYALSEAISITNSKIGYIYFYNEKTKQFTLNTWSKEVMKECTVMDPQTIYDLDKTGCWGEAVRQRKAIVINDYSETNSLKKGTPDGHVRLQKFLTVPVFSDNKIVAVAGVANKETDYENSDTIQLTLLMDNVWKISERISLIEKLNLAKEKAEANEFLVKEKNEEYLSINEELNQTIEELDFAKQRAEESDRLKSAFLANMSHEIRTPMNGIIGFAKLLMKPDLEEEKLKYFSNIIVDSSNQLLRIVNDILDISRIETNQVIVHEDRISLNELLNTVYDFYKPKAEELNLKFHLKIGLNDSDANIISDELKLRQVLNNLVSNAFKYTHKGAIEFGYKLNDKKLEFFVKDTGIGIDPKFHDKLFDRFIRAVEDSENIYGGTGLGLAICKGYLNHLDGELWFNSEHGKGSTFYFSLPYKESNQIEQISDKKNIKENILNHHQILVVEDEPVNFLYLEEILKELSLDYIHVETGIDAINEVKSNPKIDLVLMDIKLPGMNGYEATSEIKKIRNKLPVIAQTAYAMESDKVEALKAGCDDYISKPIIEENLINILNKYL